MIVQIPVGFQPTIGQKEEFTITGKVLSVSENPEDANTLLATVEISDPMMQLETRSFTPMAKNRKIDLRAEMRGG